MTNQIELATMIIAQYAFINFDDCIRARDEIRMQGKEFDDEFDMIDYMIDEAIESNFDKVNEIEFDSIEMHRFIMMNANALNAIRDALRFAMMQSYCALKVEFDYIDRY